MSRVRILNEFATEVVVRLICGTIGPLTEQVAPIGPLQSQLDSALLPEWKINRYGPRTESD